MRKFTRIFFFDFPDTAKNQEGRCVDHYNRKKKLKHHRHFDEVTCRDAIREILLPFASKISLIYCLAWPVVVVSR